ncbi:unnamed protein product [Cochlearia groenlandica]
MDYEISRIGEIVEGDVEEEIDLAPGFRFHPTDEELISHYLKPKVSNTLFTALAIGEADLNKVEPWDLPWKAKIGEKEWYFFCVRDRKYPTGLRTNRATKAGYWKATGKDKEIFKGKSLVGMKKTLVFYKGRAPKGLKTNWVMHEYRLEGESNIDDLPKTAKNEWVISRVLQKREDGKKMHISGLMMFGSGINRFEPVGLPKLIDSHVTCFSEDKSLPYESKDKFNLTTLCSSSKIGSLIDSNVLLDSQETKVNKNLQDYYTSEYGHDDFGLTGPVNIDCYLNF